MQVPAQVEYEKASSVRYALALLARYAPGVCRCTGYENIVRPVLWAAKHKSKGDHAPTGHGAAEHGRERT